MFSILVYWLFIFKNHSFVVHSISINKASLTTAGKYTCVVSNAYGHGTKIFYLNVEGINYTILQFNSM